MPTLAALPQDELEALHRRVLADHHADKARGLAFDMTRGKPSPEQLDLANGMLALPGNRDHFTASGEDARNYGGLQGLPEVRALFADILGAPADGIALGNNSSLALMHDCLAWALLKGVPGSRAPWAKEEIAFLCPAPGYDRHFQICDAYGVRLIPMPLTGHGPDMDAVEAAVADPAVKGIWVMPVYSNPTGEVVSEETGRRLAAMTTAAHDFRIFWDNAYAVHHLTDRHHAAPDILRLCRESGHPDRPFLFASTSKVTLAGAGLAAFAGSPANLAWYLGCAGVRTIGPDKLNQLRHLRFLKDRAGLARHMAAHRAILAPKFAAVLDALEARLGGTGAASWSRPEGGYFVSVNATDGTARRVVALAREAGVALTPAGATWPHGHDPHDRTLRLAPSYPALGDVRQAAEVIATCILLAAIEAAQAGRAAGGSREAAG